MPYPIEFIGGRQAPNAPGVVSWIRNLWGVLPATRGGPGRHGVSNAFYLYMRDPDGHLMQLIER